MASGGNKQYGLLLSKKGNQGLLQPKPSIFDNDSDSETEKGADWVKKSIKLQHEETFQKKQNILDMERALEQDPTVYQYDEIYDKIEEKKNETVTAKKSQEKKPRYIQSLLQQAEKRKLEHERRVERQIQKEREAEGEEFKDKEAFVTSAYRQKLEDFKKQEEEEKLKDQLDELTDVSKQKDLSGFYRYLYKQNEAKDSPPETQPVTRQETEADKKAMKPPPVTSKETKEKKSSRHYRSRKDLTSDSEDETSGAKKSKLGASEDADSDITGDSSSSDGSSSSSDTSDSDVEDNSTSKQDDIEKSETKKVKSHVDPQKHKEDVQEDKNIDLIDNQRKTTQPEIPKKSIWEKRTVGAVFDNALQRYLVRKANKFASSG